MPGCGLLRGKQQNATNTNRQQKQGFGKTFQIGQHADGKYTKTTPALKAFGKVYFAAAKEAACNRKTMAAYPSTENFSIFLVVFILQTGFMGVGNILL
jgi:hypothetical protein